MSDDGRADLDGDTITDRDQIWPRRFDNGVVANPDILPDFYASPAIEPDPPLRCARHMTGQHLQKPVLQSREKIALLDQMFAYSRKNKRRDAVLHRSYDKMKPPALTTMPLRQRNN